MKADNGKTRRTWETHGRTFEKPWKSNEKKKTGKNKQWKSQEKKKTWKIRKNRGNTGRNMKKQRGNMEKQGKRTRKNNGKSKGKKTRKTNTLYRPTVHRFRRSTIHRFFTVLPLTVLYRSTALPCLFTVCLRSPFCLSSSFFFLPCRK